MKTLAIYLMCGAATPKLAEAAVEGGADIVELGFPFSDPLAAPSSSAPPTSRAYRSTPVSASRPPSRRPRRRRSPTASSSGREPSRLPQMDQRRCASTSRRFVRPSIRHPWSARSDVEHSGAANLATTQALEPLVRLLERKCLHARPHRDLRRQREELLAVTPGQVRNRPQHPLAPEQLVRKGRDVRHVDARADDG